MGFKERRQLKAWMEAFTLWAGEQAQANQGDFIEYDYHYGVLCSILHYEKRVPDPRNHDLYQSSANFRVGVHDAGALIGTTMAAKAPTSLDFANELLKIQSERVPTTPPEPGTWRLPVPGEIDVTSIIAMREAVRRVKEMQATGELVLPSEAPGDTEEDAAANLQSIRDEILTKAMREHLGIPDDDKTLS